MTRTVTVRIASPRKTDKDKGRTPPSFDYDNMSHHWITAEVPVPDLAPAPTEIAGRAEPAEG
jgi:hypothetical protein